MLSESLSRVTPVTVHILSSSKVGNSVAGLRTLKKQILKASGGRAQIKKADVHISTDG